MSTPDVGAVELPGSRPPPSAGVDEVPDLALVARIANELFAELPGRVAAAAPLPPVPAGVPFTPPTSSLSPGWSPLPELAPAAAPVSSPAPIPAPPSVPPAAPPLGVTSGLPADPAYGLPYGLGVADLALVPPGFGAREDSLPAPTGLPAPQGISSRSPAGMPSPDQLAAVPAGWSAVMGFVAQLPLSSHPDAAVPVSASTLGATAVDEPLASSSVAAVPVRQNGDGFRPALVAFPGASARPFDPQLIRRDFPILSEQVHGKRLVWLDNAATTQKPRAVIDRLSYFYEHENSNIHRAAHAIAARATDAYEGARDKVRRFLNAASAEEIVFVRGATEAINLVASTWGSHNVGAGDEVLITWLEHHANIVPWQMLCQRTGAVLKVAPVDDTGQVILSEYQRLVGPRTKLVAFTQVSNALGTVTPSREMIEIAHRQGACVLLDAAQSVSHLRTDVQALDCDFLVFSGHKIFGPTGIGVVYGKAEALAGMPPYQGGGNMIADVTFDRTVYQRPPGRFEAGTGNIADAVGLGAALDYLTEVGIDNVEAYEHELLTYTTAGLLSVPGLRLIGTAADKASVSSFVLAGWRTEDVGAALDREGIAVRSGHHCAQPILRRFGVETSVRPSLAMYNTFEDIDLLVSTLLRLQSGRR
jgi:cysteine desulfurase / selenocysteine lyase